MPINLFENICQFYLRFSSDYLCFTSGAIFDSAGSSVVHGHVDRLSRFSKRVFFFYRSNNECGRFVQFRIRIKMGSGHKERSGCAGIVLFVIICDQRIIFTQMYNDLSITKSRVKPNKFKQH